MQLAAKMRKGLTKYMTSPSPQVTVSILEIDARHCAGNTDTAALSARALLPGVAVLQAPASTGAFTQFARPTKIDLYCSRQEWKQRKIPSNYQAGTTRKRPFCLKPVM
jgi:hypothetical protein